MYEYPYTKTEKIVEALFSVFEVCMVLAGTALIVLPYLSTLIAK